jgi:hypothetical protein
MTEHRHHVAGRALRLLIAQLRDPLDELEAQTILIDEINGCELCWFLVAQDLAGMLTTVVLDEIRKDPRKHREGYIRWLEQRLAEQLDHDDEDDDFAA